MCIRDRYCTNPECQAKHVKAFALFASRDALNIEGLSEATLEKFIDRGFIKEFTDIFHLDKWQEEIQTMEGFGEKSYKNLIANVEKAKVTTLPKVIYLSLIHIYGRCHGRDDQKEQSWKL